VSEVMIFAGIGALFFAIWFVELFYGVSIGLSCILFVVPFSFFLVYILEKNKINEKE